MKKAIPKKSDDIAEWYNRLILEADLADYGPAKGTMIFKPYGFAIWEQIRAAMDPLIQDHGVENAYFPLFIPMSFLEKEKQHMEGFAPELAVVTHGGGEKLEESLAVRPTSETAMYHSYAKWIQSWRDLPLKMNQWNNVVRWEKRTYMFMRTTEFLWQEGHTAHATHEEALETQKWAMNLYEKIYKEHLAVFGYAGWKSSSERFAGADTTLSYEALMPSGKALQSCTSHDLGQNFSKTFDIRFQDKGGKESYAWQTSWGLSTRSIGGLILAHGDDNGLRLPPRIAPVQVVVLPVRSDDKKQVEYSESVVAALTKVGLRAKLDARDDETIGFRINKWELKGAPQRIEIGDREVSDKQVTVARRDMAEKKTISLGGVEHLAELLEHIQAGMLKATQEFTEAHTHDAKNLDDLRAIMKESKGIIRCFWSDDPAQEAKVKAETKATSRCLPLGDEGMEGKNFVDGSPAKGRWLFAQSY